MENTSFIWDKFPCKNRILNFIVMFVFFVLLSFGNDRDVQASSASVTVSAENSTVVKGDTIYIVITVKSSDEIGGFTGYFSYDNSVIKYVTGGNVISGNDDEFLVSDTDRESGKKTIKYAVKFIARKAGHTRIELKHPYAVYSSEDSSEMSVSYSALDIFVEKKVSVTKTPESTEAPESTKTPEPTEKPEPLATPGVEALGSSKLGELEVDGMSLSPGFSPDIFKYSGIITTDASELDISYEAEDINATVTVKGNKDITKGRNIIKLVVKSSTGEKSTYRLSVKVNRTYSSGKSEDEGISATLREGQTVLHTEEEYTVVPLSDKELIPDGFGAAEMKVSGQLITVYASESDTEHRFVLIYCSTDNSEPEFYLYDKDELTMMPYSKVQAWYRGSNDSVVVTGGTKDNEVQKYKYLLAIMVILCLLLVIIIISVYMHFKGMTGDELTEVLKMDANDIPDGSETEKDINDKRNIESKEENWKRHHAWQGRSFDDDL